MPNDFTHQGESLALQWETSNKFDKTIRSGNLLNAIDFAIAHIRVFPFKKLHI
jgi:hypothetical protein